MVNDITKTDDLTAICDKTLQKAAITELIDAIQPEPKRMAPQPTYRVPAQYSSTVPRLTNAQRSTTQYPSGFKKSKLTDTEKELLAANNGCFKCRKINARHISFDYPEGKRASSTSINVKREEVSIVDGYVVRYPSPEQDVNSSLYHSSVPTIVVSAQIHDSAVSPARAQIPTVSSNIDTGASINVITLEVVKKRHLTEEPATLI